MGVRGRMVSANARAWLGWALLSVLPAGCSNAVTFACQEDADCGEGLCEATGYCSFPDDSCDSGRRYGELAEPGLANECVSDDGGSTTASSSSTATSTPSPQTSGTDASSTTADTVDPLTATGTATTSGLAEGSTSDDTTSGGTTSIDTHTPTDTSTGPDSDGSTGTPTTCGNGIKDLEEFCFDLDTPETLDVMGRGVDLAVADFDNNESTDIVVLTSQAPAADSPSQLCAYRADGLDGFLAPDCADVGTGARRVRILDGNLDGANEAGVLSEGRFYVVRHSDSDSNISAIGFNLDTASLSASPGHDFSTDDFDGNGGIDIAFNESFSQRTLGSFGPSATQWTFPSNSDQPINGVPGEGAAGTVALPGMFVDWPHPVIFALNRFESTIYGTTLILGAYEPLPEGNAFAEFDACGDAPGVGSLFGARGNWTGDASRDLVVTCTNDAFAMLVFSESGYVSIPTTLAGARRPHPGQVLGDEADELLVTSDALDAAVLYSASIDEGFSPLGVFDAGGELAGAALADVNNDGAVDVITYANELEAASSVVRVWYQDP